MPTGTILKEITTLRVYGISFIRISPKLCPIRKLTMVENKPDWLSNDLILLMRQRDKAYRRARHSNLLGDWDTAKRMRNRVRMEVNLNDINTTLKSFGRK